MKKVYLFVVILFSSFLISSCSQPASDQKTNDNQYFISNIGYFYVGGKRVRSIDAPTILGRRATGSHIIDQVGVLHLHSSRPNSSSVIMSPGFGLAGHIYLETTDGRPGWAHQFLHHGHDVYILDRSHTARTGLEVSRFNNVKEGGAAPSTQPGLILWLDEQIWSRWGLGPEFGAAFDNGQFPLASIDQLVSAFTAVPVLENDLKEQAIGNSEGLITLLEKIGPATIITHSASGRDGFEVALQRPELVAAIVTVEPVGCNPAEAEALVGMPVLAVFGDHFEVRKQMIPRFEECLELTQAINRQGGKAHMLHLPEEGVHGNSHILMSDKNSEEVALRILELLSELKG